MSPTRREVLAQLAALAVLPLPTRVRHDDDPLDGTIADYQAGRRRGAWTAAEVTARALERCRADGMRWRAIDALSPTPPSPTRAPPTPACAPAGCAGRSTASPSSPRRSTT